MENKNLENKKTEKWNTRKMNLMQKIRTNEEKIDNVVPILDTNE